MFPTLACYTAETAPDLRGAIRAATAANAPSVVEILCATDEVPPFAPFLISATPKEESHDRDHRGTQSLARA